MKKKIHPEYFQTGVTCACGNTFKIGSTMAKAIRVEVCYACHPFYTGQQKIIDSTGRVDRFKRRSQTAKDMEIKQKQDLAAKLAKKSGMDEEVAVPVETVTMMEEQLVEIPQEGKPVPMAKAKPVKQIKKVAAVKKEAKKPVKKAVVKAKPTAKKPAVKKAASVKKPVAKKTPAKKPLARKKK